MASSKSYIKGFFDNIRERVEDRAEKNLRESLPMLAFLMHEYALEEMKKNKKSSMTGNWINSFGIALYRDGRFVAVATSHDEEGQTPVHITLAAGDTFNQWEVRYDGKKQFHAFTATQGTEHFYANEEVIEWLQKYPPTRKKGFSFRAVSVVDYTDIVGGEKVLLRLADDFENMGGIVTEYNLG